MTRRDVSFLAIGLASAIAGNLFAVMLVYLRLVNQDAKEDRKAIRDALAEIKRPCIERDGS